MTGLPEATVPREEPCHVCGEVLQTHDGLARFWRGVYFHDACMAKFFGEEA